MTNPTPPLSSKLYSILVEKLSIGVINMLPSALIVLPSALPLNVIDLYCSTFDNVNSKSVPFFCSNIHVVPFSHGPDTSFNMLMFLSHFSHL